MNGAESAPNSSLEESVVGFTQMGVEQFNCRRDSGYTRYSAHFGHKFSGVGMAPTSGEADLATAPLATLIVSIIPNEACSVIGVRPRGLRCTSSKRALLQRLNDTADA